VLSYYQFRDGDIYVAPAFAVDGQNGVTVLGRIIESALSRPGKDMQGPISRPISGQISRSAPGDVHCDIGFCLIHRGAALVTSTVSDTPPGERLEIWVDVLPTAILLFVSTVENPGAVA